MAFCLLSSYAFTQDVIFSNFNSQDQLHNPANSPLNFENNSKGILAVRYRDQWNAISPDAGFRSSSILANYKILSSELDHWNLGVSFLDDKSDNSVFNLNSLEANGSYTRKIYGQHGTHNNSLYVSAGISMSYNQLDNISGLWFGRQFNNQTLDIDYTLSSGENFITNQVSYYSIGAGIRWKYVIDKNTSYVSGISVSHLNNPSIGFIQENSYLNSKFNFYFDSEFSLNSNIQQEIGIFVSMQQPSFQILPSYMLKFLINNEDSVMKLGLASRLSNSINKMTLDAFIIKFGLESKQWGAQLNYEVNVSSLNQFTSSNGAFELSLFYILF